MASKETRVKCSTKCCIKGEGGRKYLFRKLVKTALTKVLRTRGKLGGVKYERRSRRRHNFVSDSALIIYVRRRNRQKAVAAPPTPSLCTFYPFLSADSFSTIRAARSEPWLACVSI